MDINKLPPEKYREGINEIIENAEKLAEAGLLLFKSGHYGAANSMFILSCEEAVKAFAVYNKYLVDDNRDISTVFKSHKEKISILKGAYHLMKAETTAMAESFQQAFRELPQGRNAPPEEIERRVKELHPEKYLKAVKKTDSKEDEWWDKADLLKQQGFYVNYKEGKWLSPQNITQEQAAETGARANFIVSHMYSYKDVKESKFKSKKSKQSD